jgi:hypothetical protein
VYPFGEIEFGQAIQVRAPQEREGLPVAALEQSAPPTGRACFERPVPRDDAERGWW